MRPFSLMLLLSGCYTQPYVPDTRPANACEASAFTSGEMVLPIELGRQKRRALVWMPPGAGPHDVVVSFHEHRASPRTQIKYSGWVDQVDDQNVILVAPDGRYATWNAGECCGRAVEKHIDDVAFLNAVIERLDEVACTSGNVVATGIGAGGMMAEMWSCESNHVDGVISVGGSLQWKECRNPRPVPYLHYHGSDDQFVPMDASPSGLVAQEKLQYSVEHAFTLWAQRNAATEGQTVHAGDLSCRTWDGQAPLHACTIRGGLDTWPGAPGSVVDSPSALADATVGGMTWMRAQWAEAHAAEAKTVEGHAVEGHAVEAGQALEGEKPADGAAPTDSAPPADGTPP